MGNKDTLSGQIAVPTLLLAVLENKELILVQVALDAHRLVGRSALLVPHGQGVISAWTGCDVIHPTHKHFLIGSIARRRETVVVIAAHAHDIPVAHTVMVAVTRVIKVGQA